MLTISWVWLIDWIILDDKGLVNPLNIFDNAFLRLYAATAVLSKSLFIFSFPLTLLLSFLLLSFLLSSSTTKLIKTSVSVAIDTCTHASISLKYRKTSCACNSIGRELPFGPLLPRVNATMKRLRKEICLVLMTICTQSL